MIVHESVAERWSVTSVDTGEKTGTAGRLKRVAKYVFDQVAFCMTYGDGLSDIDITARVAFHRSHRKKFTLTAVQPMARFGGLSLDGTQVYAFQEKPKGKLGLASAPKDRDGFGLDTGLIPRLG